MNNYTLLCVDPGTGSSSACGIAVLRIRGPKVEVVYLADLWTRAAHKNAMLRIRDIADQVEGLMTSFYECCEPNEVFAVAIESFVMKAKSGETLQRFIGAVLSRVPSSKTEILEINNMQMKKFVTGTGKADKEAIMHKIVKRFPDSKIVLDAALKKNEDALDALGIGLAAIGRLK
jgi:Holliday junction resolvasome RuvABC endonuclease subunit